MRLLLLISVTAIMLLLGSPVVPTCLAQPVVEPHDLVRVRVLSAESRRMEIVRGVVHEVNAEGLVIRPLKAGDAHRITASEIIRIDRGESNGSYAGAGAAVGVLAFGTAGAFWGYATTKPCTPYDFCIIDRQGGAILGAVLGGFLGAIPGLLIGAQLDKTVWSRVDLPGKRDGTYVDLKVSGRNGLGLRLTH